ncbi:MAG: hypothetical protein RIS76_2308 [Verrucomicrobiota bacterium]|jgi:hypothetical protein
MNRTLLLIMCDFLLLNLLALTRWDKSEPETQRSPPAVSAAAGTASGAREDLLASLRETLAEEQAQRDALNRRMSSEVATREASLTELEEKRRQLETALTQTRQTATQLDEKLAVQTQQAAQAAEQLEQTKARLADTAQKGETLVASVQTSEAERRKLSEELEKQREQAVALAAARTEAEKQIASLNTAVKVAEAEKKLLTENVTDLKGQVNRVQEEKIRLQEQTAALARGVSQLAKSSDELKQEVRENTPINANQLYAGFLTNQVTVTLSGVGNGLLGATPRSKDAATLLVTDGTNTLALVHVNESPFSLSIPGFGLSELASRVSRDGKPLPAGRPYLTGSDPRIVAVAVDGAAARELGLRIYPLARDPFKFPEAMLLNRGGRRYGEVEFKLDPRTPDFVRMKNRLFSGVFGEFSPSAGDLVLSKTGELLGVMVNSDYCAVLKNFQPAPGGIFEAGLSREAMGKRLEAFKAQVNSLPSALQ